MRFAAHVASECVRIFTSAPHTTPIITMVPNKTNITQRVLYGKRKSCSTIMSVTSSLKRTRRGSTRLYLYSPRMLATPSPLKVFNTMTDKSPCSGLKTSKRGFKTHRKYTILRPKTRRKSRQNRLKTSHKT
ncbi:hypothetical protein [Bufonid herpesvirus 1]|uniref:hypothetical protein n=1 Tax=Bufonid herpesvirus 1 TaxID=2282206 RepID=UPI000EB6C4CF|nr:hypothetical protein [Bufonid herpesvirus 1]AXF48503.1 hypothetical protein [Bufonid herpesvirus 1]